MIHQVRVHYDYALFAVVSAVMAAVLVWGVDTSRQRSSVLGVMVVAGVLVRLITFWSEMTVLEVVLAVSASLTIALGAVGTYRLDLLDAPPSGVITWVIASRVLWLGIILVWPRLVGHPTSEWRVLFSRPR